MAVKRNPFVEDFQQALLDSGVSVRVTGVWGEQTKNAMQAFQDESGLDVTAYPDADTMALLGLHPSAWVAVALGAGAPKTLIAEISSVAKKQQALSTAEAMKGTFAPAQVSRVSRTGDGGFVEEVPAEMQPRGAGRVPRPTEPSPEIPAGAAALAPRKMPTWGWVALGIGAVVLVGGGVVYVIHRRRQEPAMGVWR